MFYWLAVDFEGPSTHASSNPSEEKISSEKLGKPEFSVIEAEF